MTSNPGSFVARNCFVGKVRMSMMLQKQIVCPILVLASAVLALNSAHAGDWAQWGGSQNRNMISTETNLPDDWSPGEWTPKGEWDTTKAKNVKWVAKLGSESYGNVTVSGGKVFVGTNNSSPRNPNITGDRGVVMCFDEATGNFLWQLTVPKLKEGRVNDWPGIGICSSPTVDGDRVYVVTNRGELLCLSVDGLKKGNRGPFKNEGMYIKDPDKLAGEPLDKFASMPVDDNEADIIWRMDMRDPEVLGAFPHNMSNCSVLIDGDRLYCTSSNGVDWGHSYVPSALAPSYFCVNKMTGEELWEDELNLANSAREDCGLARRIFHGIWSNPSLGAVNGKKQVYYGGPDGCLYALDAETGKTAWWGDCVLPKQKKFESGQFIAYGPSSPKGPSEIDSTPVFLNNRVYVTNGQDPEHGAGDGVLTCWDATKTGDATATGKIWYSDKIHRSIASPSIVGDLLFVGDFSGYIHCFDANTGQKYWEFPSGARMWGSTMVADGKIYFGNDGNQVFIMEATKEAPKVLSKVKLKDYVRSTPVVANGVIYIVSNTHLFAIQKK